MAKDRDCGSCQLCCSHLPYTLPGGRRIGMWQSCPCQTAFGCGIYKNRPSLCKNYKCAWLVGYDSEENRPNQVGFVMSLNKIFWVVSEVTRGISFGKIPVKELRSTHKLPIIVCSFEMKEKEPLLVLPRSLQLVGMINNTSPGEHFIGTYKRKKWPEGWEYVRKTFYGES